jgi:hypothetical protein
MDVKSQAVVLTQTQKPNHRQPNSSIDLCSSSARCRPGKTIVPVLRHPLSSSEPLLTPAPPRLRSRQRRSVQGDNLARSANHLHPPVTTLRRLLPETLFSLRSLSFGRFSFSSFPGPLESQVIRMIFLYAASH